MAGLHSGTLMWKENQVTGNRRIRKGCCQWYCNQIARGLSRDSERRRTKTERGAWKVIAHPLCNPYASSGQSLLYILDVPY